MKSTALTAFVLLATVVTSHAQLNFDSLRSSLVVIETESGSGSGFIVRLDGKVFLLTNRHVVQGAGKLKFRLVDGQVILPQAAEIADSQDLVRFSIKDDSGLIPLQLADAPPTLSQTVSVYGNSEGQGAVTKLDGQILGVGPEVIEVNAGFVPGNSGSPIVSASGGVFGVATYLTMNTPGKDWVTRGTRFETVRRFGVRVADGMQWIPISWKTFKSQVDLLEETDAFLGDLFTILACWRNYQGVADARTQFEQYASANRKTVYQTKRWASNLDAFMFRYKEYWSNRSKFVEQSMSVKNSRRQLETVLRGLPLTPFESLKKTQWVNSDLKEEAQMRLDLLELFAEEVQKVLNDDERFWRFPIIKVGRGY
jgi:hypothetical protein